MEIDLLPNYQSIIDDLNSKNRIKHLLFGNGFSISYDPAIFSYNALSNFIETVDDDLLKQLFRNLNTKNFELIMQQLDNFIEIAKIFSEDDKLVKKIEAASEKLKTSLIDAVQQLHPDHVFTIPENESNACFQFLKEFIEKGGQVFSTNYDLLPYWVLMRNDANLSTDGFGKDLENSSDEYEHDPQYSELRWGKYKETQNIFYLHGSLLIFDTGADVVKEIYGGENFLIENIKARMAKKEYPIFVTAGNANEKLTHISHSKYLTYCYDSLSSIKGSLITFGFNFGPYDTHIISAINKAARNGNRGAPEEKLVSIYIGVYSDNDLNYINQLIADKKFKCKVTPYDARTVNIWGR